MWKVIEKFPNYEISTSGEIRSIKTSKIKKTFESEKGYLRVQLYKGNKKSNQRVHRLVAETFIPNPNNLPEVNHIDENKHNNDVLNLQWVTHEENLKHSGLGRKSVVQLDKRGNYIAEYESITEAVKAVNGNHNGIYRVLNDKRKTHRNYVWRYKDVN